MNRSAERIDFLSDLLITATEHGGYGAFDVESWDYRDGNPGDGKAVIRFYDDPRSSYVVDIDVMAKGLGIIRNAVKRQVKRPGPGGRPEEVFHNASTGQRLYLGSAIRAPLLLADRTNGDDGDYDVIGALAVLEIALFGAVRYA